MKFLLEFAKFRNLTLTTDPTLLSIINKPFVEDEKLLNSVFLDDLNKRINIKWNNTPYHPMIDRIKKRASFNSISEFNEVIDKTIRSIIPKEINNSINKTARYGLYLENNKFYILIDINYDKLFDDTTIFYIVSISISTPICYKVLNINDDDF